MGIHPLAARAAGILLLFTTGAGTVWYTATALEGSAVGNTYLPAFAAALMPVIYATYRRRAASPARLVVVLASASALAILCYIASPIWTLQSDVQLVWLVDAMYEPDSGTVFLMFSRDVVLLDESGITAHAGLDAYGLADATPAGFTRMIILEAPDALRGPPAPGIVITMGPAVVGATDPNTFPQTMPPAIVIPVTMGSGGP